MQPSRQATVRCLGLVVKLMCITTLLTSGSSETNLTFGCHADKFTYFVVPTTTTHLVYEAGISLLMCRVRLFLPGSSKLALLGLVRSLLDVGVD